MWSRALTALARWPCLVLAACLALAPTACSGSDTRDDAPPVHAGKGSGARKVSGARKMESVDRRDGPLVIARPVLDKVLAAGPGWLLGQVPLAPIFDKNRKFIGYRIVSLFGDDPAVLRYGVLPGDRLLSVQGKAIVVPTDIMSVYGKLRTDNWLQVRVLRGGIEQQLRWPIVRPGEELPTAPTATGDDSAPERDL